MKHCRNFKYQLESIKYSSALYFKLKGNSELQAMVDDFYKRNYWNHLNLDDLANQELANQVFDTAVNCGIKPAVKIIQKVLGIPADGKLGPVTIEAMKKIKG